MYTLYFSPGSASLVVHWLLIELNAPHELKRLDLDAGEQRSAEYLKINPNGTVPALLIDGAPYYESAGMLLTLADRHPEARLAPAVGSNERALYNQWIVHLANTLMPAFRHWFYPSEMAGEATVDAVKAFARTRIEATWDRFEAHLSKHGPYLTGADISAADFLLAMLMRWSRNMPKPATQWPALGAFAARIKARPSFKTLYAREGLTEWA